MDLSWEQMPLEMRVGQMMMLSFDGEASTPQLSSLIQEYHIGGVVLSRRNCRSPEQLWHLCGHLQALARAGQPGLPLFISVDQEGGRVARLEPPFTMFPSPRSLGRAWDEALVAAVARVVGREMRAVGINMNLAPVLDVDTNPANPIIGDRALHADPRAVARLGVAFLQALQREGVVATGKHFPGHGDTSFDSHLELGTVARPAEVLEMTELVPFRAAIEAGLEAVMTAHVLYPAWDAELPATLSQAILTGLLRRDLGYRRLVVTDDLGMGAIAGGYPIEEAAVMAVRAGADILLLCSAGHDDQARMIEAVRAAAEAGDIPEERITSAAERILDCKRRYLANPEPRPLEEVRATVGCPEHRAIAQRGALPVSDDA